MSYVSVAKLRVALAPLGQAPNDTDTAADLEDPQLQDALDQASSIVDTAIAARYAVPVAAINPEAEPESQAWPHPVDYWTRDIAAYLATCTYRGSIDFTDNDPIYRRFIFTIASLNDIKKGIGRLELPTAPESVSNTQAGQPINPYIGKLFEPSDFDLTTSLGFRGDPSLYGQDRGWF